MWWEWGWGSPCGGQEAERREQQIASSFTSSIIHLLQVVLLDFHYLPKLHHHPETELPRHDAMEDAPYLDHDKRVSLYNGSIRLPTPPP